MKRGVYIPLPLGEKEVADYGVIGTLQVKLWNGKEPRGGRSYVRVLDICIFLQLQCKISIARFFRVMYIPNCRKTKSSTHLVLKLVFNHFNAFLFDHHAVFVNWGSMCACESFVSFKNDNAD